MSDNNWWVVKTRSRAEKKLEKLLNDAGWEACCPTYTTIRQWSDRKKKIQIPLISCVVFVRENEVPSNDLYQYSQVISVLKEHAKPALVRDSELQNLMILCGQWQEDLIAQENYNSYKPGDSVEVISGNFKGMKGEMIKTQGKHKLVVSIKSLQMSFSILVPKTQLKPIPKKEQI